MLLLPSFSSFGVDGCELYVMFYRKHKKTCQNLLLTTFSLNPFWDYSKKADKLKQMSRWLKSKIKQKLFCVLKNVLGKCKKGKAIESGKKTQNEKIITCEFCEWLDGGWWLLMSDNWRRITPGLCRKSLSVLAVFWPLCVESDVGICPIDVEDVM